MKTTKIEVECQEGICPVCGGALNYDGTDRHERFHLWTCSACWATGKEGYREAGKDSNNPAKLFDGEHFDVELANGTPVKIIPINELAADDDPEPVTVEAICKEGICPVCGGKAEDTGNESDGDYSLDREWRCAECGATGWANYDEEWKYTFSGEHNDVVKANGTPVNIVMPQNVMLWKVPVTWEMCGYAYVAAPTLAAAIEKVRSDNDNIPLPSDADYVDGSFAPSYDDVEEIRSLHNDNKSDPE